ncbi:hypothetical protein [Dolichospermum flos-aquae]|uniref:Uncharacterized protein n=1 Tax=Dolichospermum flos-aquae CCAP 1403/13F TaxID=315271 RepID=A0A6H2C2E3_DOLFA|nr:hypothetical protein [Dolichospermum flos-aquae]QJB46002.1 hypothetical protein HGD76_19345 [Dolichospermum flos-aquae CCAP 1403/13F]
MISNLKILNHYYMQIITNEQELIATKNQINSILDQRNITQDDRDIVLDILNGKRQLTANQIQDLAVFFQIDPTYLVA